MADREWQIGICGTFDVANYGDLLFPLIAESELAERLGPLTLHRFSYNAKTRPDWPYEVTSVSALPHMMQRLDGLLIGGGFVVRFDKDVAPGYAPPTLDTHHPTGYWLTPALMALQHDVPVAWNAPGMHCNDIPKWALPLLDIALTHSRYVSVRDEPSRAALQPLTNSPVSLVPDTAFGLPRLLNLDGPPSAAFRRIAEAGLDGPYIVVQASANLDGLVRSIKEHPNMSRFQILGLPISPIFGDGHGVIHHTHPGTDRLDEWPHPLIIAELIARSEAVFGHSYHLLVTALAAGVPVFTPVNLALGKFSALQGFETMFDLPAMTEPDLDWMLDRVGRTTPSASARARSQQLRDHWDHVAAVFRRGPTSTTHALNAFWQSLPTLLENAVTGVAVSNPGPATDLTEYGRVINLEAIKRDQLETDPFQWALVKDLFTADHAAKLAATFPCDHFKRVAAQGGEKDYEYDARLLVGMGADVIANPSDLSEPWRALATELLSPEYRAAMMTLTGCDLTQAPMEVNVFHYGPGALLGPHPDLADKVVTHVLYFNTSWDTADGGCLNILRSADPTDSAAEILPIVGHSVVLVRSENSWHAVSPVVNDSASSRRSVTVTFYRPGAVSSMWPAATRNWGLTDDQFASDDALSPTSDIAVRDAEILRLQEVLAQQSDWNRQLADYAAKADAEILRLQAVLAEQTDWNRHLREYAATDDAEIVRLQGVLAEQTRWNLQLREQAATEPAEMRGPTTGRHAKPAFISRAVEGLRKLLRL